VYVLEPAHISGSGLSIIVSRTAVILLPHTSVTTGGVGATASTTHAIVYDPSAGTTGIVDISIV